MDNILENRDISYHGINFDYIKMLGILQYGILSYDAAIQLGINLNRNYEGYNGNSNISLSESPSIKGTYNYGAFNVFVKNGISFVIDTSNLKCIPDNKSYIPGEIYVNYKIPIENIIGIMLPEQSLNIPISQLNIFAGIGKGYIDNYALSFIDKTNLLFNTNFSKEEIISLIEEKKQLSGDFFEKNDKKDQINNKIIGIVTQYFNLGMKQQYSLSEDPTLFDTVAILSNGRIPIYSSNGELLTQNNKKIIIWLNYINIKI